MVFRTLTHKTLAHIGAFAATLLLLTPGSAQASGLVDGILGDDGATDFTTIAQNITKSIDDIPGLVSALAYLIALVLGVWGILKIKDHVENPQQTRLSEGVTRFLAGGALLSLPTLYEAMRRTIGGGGSGFDGGDASLTSGLSSMVGSVFSALPIQGVNQVMSAMTDSISGVPGLISAAAYLIGIILGIWGVLNIKENIESGQNNPPMREGIGRILTGGALFALPTVFEATKNAIEGDGLSAFDFLGEALGIGGMIGSGGASCASAGGTSIGGLGALASALSGGSESGGTIGGVLCSSVLNTMAIPGFLASVAYLLGLVLGLWAIFKLRDYIINPQQTQAWDFVSRFAASGAFFALPTVTRAITNSIGNESSLLTPHSTSGFAGAEDGSGESGLDNMLISLMDNAYGPAIFVVNWFGYVAGSILIFIGISRLLKSSQEGPRGPGGAGTIMTFVVGGALISFSPMVSALSTSLFSSAAGGTATYAVLQTGGEAMSEEARGHVLLVISAVVKFMIFVGLVSIMRGIFLVRDVAEGSQQASLMAAMTHLIGGALAVNLGPLMNAVQSTLGITELGVQFGGEGGSGGASFGGVADSVPMDL